MKTDDNYIYPETAEELAMFYGWECEEQLKGEGDWVVSGISGFEIDYVDDHGLKLLLYRLPLPTISDLKVGDVVKWPLELNDGYWYVEIEDEEDLKSFKDVDAKSRPISLLIGRNTWVPVKCN